LTDDDAMRLALEQAMAALAHRDVPIGAVVVRDGEVVAARHNERELTGIPPPTPRCWRSAMPRTSSGTGGCSTARCT
jgi:tRNA(adenine34) deaminase